MIVMPPITASNPYLDFARDNNLNYGDVLNYVGILDGVKEQDWSYWYDKATNLPNYVRMSICDLKRDLQKHYFKDKNV